MEYRISKLEEANLTIAKAVDDLRDFSIKLNTTINIFLFATGCTSIILPTIVAFVLNKYF